jgi:hypothetical protein
MNENIKWIAGAVAVVGLSVGAVLYVSRDKAPPPAEEPVVAPPVAPPVEDPDVAKHPLPEPVTDAALPPLEGSDPMLQSSLTELIGKSSVERFVNPENLVRHFVVTVDNLPELKVAERLRPLKRVDGAFAVTGTEEAPVMDPANFDRYKVMIDLLRATDTKLMVATYRRYYPLLQESYEALGHPPKHFNDRLIQVIDVLLATPDIREPIPLARPGVLYEFADHKLEALPAGQKVLLRMGSANAQHVKSKLRELRDELTNLPAD